MLGKPENRLSLTRTTISTNGGAKSGFLFLSHIHHTVKDPWKLLFICLAMVPVTIIYQYRKDKGLRPLSWLSQVGIWCVSALVLGLMVMAWKSTQGPAPEKMGPTFSQFMVKENHAIVSFEHVGRGLEVHGSALMNFSVCGPDRKFVWARAEIVGNTVVVSHPSIESPLAVRYQWLEDRKTGGWFASYAHGNLRNKDGLYALEFRTDTFPLITTNGLAEYINP